LTTPDDFLSDASRDEIDWARQPGYPVALQPQFVQFGNGPEGFEVAFARTVVPTTDPKADEVRALWKARWNRRAAPVALVVAHQDATGDWKASVCGTKDDPAVVAGLPLDQVDRIVTATLGSPDAATADRTFHRLLVGQKDSLVAGLTNVGLFASHELRTGVPNRPDYAAARQTAEPLLRTRGQDLIRGLGYTMTPHGSTANILSADGANRAVAVFLDEHEVFDRAAHRFNATSPVAQGMAIAAAQNLPWLLITRGTQIRLYPTSPDVGVGRKGQAETYTEVDLALLASADAAYLHLIFSASALAENGTADQILAASADHAAALGARLRTRVYEDVVPALAVAVANEMGATTDEDLNEAYHRTLTILFRLLFVAYAEDRGLLPYQRNPRYTRKALKTLAREFTDASDLTFDEHATDRWEDLLAVWRAVDDGNTEWGVPAYNGGLFAADKSHPIGHAIAAMTLTNAEIGPALRALLVDTDDDDTLGPVDFRSLSVREFGTIYEGLLESSLSVAATDLVVDPKTKVYLPAKPTQRPEVGHGQVYFHNASGARKSTGSYFTKKFAVEHLLDTALEPALTRHLADVERFVATGDDAAAAAKFFDFRVVDLAMGSGHFLVAAVDRIERRFSAYLSTHPMPVVTQEMNRLADAAAHTLGTNSPDVEIEASALLRRQIARRCLYGLDLNLMAVELARLGLWIHTFVPGLPMSSLDHGLIVGNSLTGVASSEHVLSLLDPDAAADAPSLFSHAMQMSLEAACDRLRRVALTAEATKQEVREAAAEYGNARKESAVAKALFDAALAVRLGLVSHVPLDEDGAVALADRHDVRPVLDTLQPAHLPVTFPEVFLRERPGFDVILGNPPWDKIRHEATQFWQVRDPGLNALPAAKRQDRIEELRTERTIEAAEERAEIALRLRLQQTAKTGYTLLGPGHYDFAKLFMERFLTMLRDGGTMGVVMPQPVLLLSGWAPLRSALLARGDLLAVEARNTGGWLFEDVDGRVTVALLSLSTVADSSNPMVTIIPGATSMERFLAAKKSAPMTMTLQEVDALTDTRVVPWFNSPGDTDVFNQMRHRPSLSSGKAWVTGRSDSSRWDFSGSGRHAAHAATTRTNPNAWRVLMTRHVDAYSLTDDPTQRWLNNPSGLATAMPRRGLVQKDGTLVLTDQHPVITYRFPSRNDDSRTIIAAALPFYGALFSTGYCHGIVHPDQTPLRDILALLGYLNTIAADWWARRFVDRHVGARIINDLRLPDWSESDRTTAAAIASELVRRGGITHVPGPRSLPGDSTDWSSLTDQDLRSQLDVLAMCGFQLSAAHAQTMFDDFKDTNESVPADYRDRLTSAMTHEEARG